MPRYRQSCPRRSSIGQGSFHNELGFREGKRRIQGVALGPRGELLKHPLVGHTSLRGLLLTESLGF